MTDRPGGAVCANDWWARNADRRSTSNEHFSAWLHEFARLLRSRDCYHAASPDDDGFAMTGNTSRLTINLAALAANYRFLAARAAPSACAAVVKADAYGLGLAPVVKCLVGAGCSAFFVATAAEGRAVRRVAPAAEIFVFAGPLPEDVDLFAAHGLVPAMNRADQLELWRAHAARPIALQVDTGMNRLGFACDDVPAAAADFDVSLLLTHLACADDPGDDLNRRQIERFDAVRARFPGVRTSIGNSAGLLSGPPFQGDLCRPGIALYGGNPYLTLPNPMRPVACMEGRVLQLRSVAAGETVGYGATHRPRGRRRIAVIGLGYGDGLPRALSNRGQVVIAGAPAPIVGRISMDLTTADVTDLDVSVAVGDWAQFFGDQLGIDAVANLLGTISYELLTRLGHRLERHYQPVTAQETSAAENGLPRAP